MGQKKSKILFKLKGMFSDLIQINNFLVQKQDMTMRSDKSHKQVKSQLYIPKIKKRLQ